MRSVSQALNLFTNALGSWLTIPLTLLVNTGSEPWIASDVNQGHLDWYFYLLAGLMFLGLVVFVYLARSFVYIQPNELEALNEDSVAKADANELEADEVVNLLIDDHYIVNIDGVRRNGSIDAKPAYIPVSDRNSDM